MTDTTQTDTALDDQPAAATLPLAQEKPEGQEVQEGQEATAAAVEPEARPRRLPNTINIRNVSVRCGRCDQYQVLVGFKPLDAEWNLYTYECDGEPCNADPGMTRTFVEVPSDLDEFANRDPNWRGGKKWGGA